MASNLWQNHSYLNKNITHILSSYISEYDIAKANIHILYEKGVINQEQFNYLYNSDRMTRQITIGNMIKNNKNIYTILQNGIIEAKKKLFIANEIEDIDVLSIKNDAVFIIDKAPVYTKFGIVEFKKKNVYTSYYNLNNIELYYHYSCEGNKEYYSIKGINDDKLMLHQNSFLELLLVVCETVESESVVNAVSLLNGIYEDYINLNMDISYYRTFDSRSVYEYKKMSTIYKYTTDMASNKDLKYIDISYNLNILRTMMSYLMSSSFKKL